MNDRYGKCNTILLGIIERKKKKRRKSKGKKRAIKAHIYSIISLSQRKVIAFLWNKTTYFQAEDILKIHIYTDPGELREFRDPEETLNLWRVRG